MNKNYLIDRLPHKKPILMIDEVIDVNDTKLKTKNKISKNNHFVNNKTNGLCETAYIELMAQTSAVHLLHLDENYNKSNNKEKLGYIVSISDFEINDTIGVEDIVIVESNIKNNFDFQYFIFVDYIYNVNNSDVIATSQIKIYVPDIQIQ